MPRFPLSPVEESPDQEWERRLLRLEQGWERLAELLVDLGARVEVLEYQIKPLLRQRRR